MAFVGQGSQLDSTVASDIAVKFMENGNPYYVASFNSLLRDACAIRKRFKEVHFVNALKRFFHYFS